MTPARLATLGLAFALVACGKAPPPAAPSSSSHASATAQADVAPVVGEEPMQRRFHETWCGTPPPAASPVMRKTCDGGKPDACRDLAKATFCGVGTKSDPPAALALLQRGCTGGSGIACNGAAVMLEFGVRVPKDAARAQAILEDGCAKKLEETCQALATLYVQRDASHVARPLAILSAECEAGVAQPCAMATSLLLEDHEDVKLDQVAGHRYAKRGCDLGSHDACAQLALFLLTGQGTTKDEAGGATLAQRACEGGSALGCLNAGVASIMGTGVDKDTVKGAALLDKACKLGNGSACRQLSELKARSGGTAL